MKPEVCRKSNRSVGRAAVLVPEVHPTCRRDAIVEECAAGLPFELSVTYYASLESSLMRAFGGGRIAPIMQSLGLGESERLAHRLLADSLRKEQQRLEKQVREESPASSQQEWFDLNLRGRIV